MNSGANTSTPDGDQRSGRSDRLWNRGFTGLMLTQVFGAGNDNLLKAILLVAVASGGLWEGILGPGGTGWVSFMLSAPFVVLLGYAGQLSDRYSKNRVVVCTRIAEVPIAVLACVGFYLDNPWLVIVAFLLLASESAFFSPSKYGVIREYTGVDQLSRANGLLNASTNVAIIAGMVAGGFLLEKGLGWAGAVLVVLAIAGLVSSLMMPRVPAVNPNLPWTWNPFKSYLQSIRSMRMTARDERGRSALWLGVLAWAIFFMIAIVLLAIVPEYRRPLGLNAFDASKLLAAVGLGIGAGCLAAAAISGRRIRLWLVPVGGYLMGGMIILIAVLTMANRVDPGVCGNAGVARSAVQAECCAELCKLDPACCAPAWDVSCTEKAHELCRLESGITLNRMIGMLLLTGFFGGFFIVPLQALQQALAEPAFRARVLGTANALSFFLMAIASALQALVMMIPGVTHDIIMLACGIGALALTTWLLVWGRSMFARRPVPVTDDGEPGPA